MSSLPSVIFPEVRSVVGVSSVRSTMMVSVIFFLMTVVFSVPSLILRSVVEVMWSLGSMSVESVQRSSGVVMVIVSVPCFGVVLERRIVVGELSGVDKS